MTSAAWTLEAVAALIPGTMLQTIGFQPLEIDKGRFVAAIEHRPNLAIRTGFLHAGTLVAFGDSCATFAALTVTDPDATNEQRFFPLAIQLSANVIRNVDRGRITGEARVIHGGRTTQVVETKITDSQGRLLATLTTTHIVVPSA
jgi:uncharacterized protein (TIGR00369 family)